MQVTLKYGKTTFQWDLSGKVDLWDIKDPEPRCDPEGFSVKMRRVLEAQRMDLSRVGIVVADKTRLCAYPVYLPRLLEALMEAGADPGNLRIFIAYGTHTRQSEAESRAAYGDVYDRFSFIHHDANERALFEHLGETPAKTPAMLRKDILACSCVITFGAVSHHYFAGYGGGRKLIFPGLGFRDAVYHNHALFLDEKSRGLAPGCRPGFLKGNPVAEDLAAYEAVFPAHLAIHGILDRHGKVCDLMVGTGPGDFRKACAAHGRYCEVRVKKQYPWVLASCGGHPKDINFIQSHKALENAARFVQDNGTLVILARCGDGVGSESFLKYFSMGGLDGAFEALIRHYEGNGGTALSMMAKTKRIRILMVTDLDENVCKAMGAEKISFEKAVWRIQNRDGPLAVIPNAGLLVRI
ncbi:MAG: DUF2088 domain-containing protein [Deltaproteobacteria bacterium]|nr:DUF2088 domain-containing protein [Deltaproteobacteria bacterium]